MIISIVIFGLLICACLAWYCESKKADSARWVALLSSVGFLGYFVSAIFFHSSNFNELTVLTRIPWIRFLNIEYALAIDYLSIILLMLTLFLAIICVLVSWQEITQRSGFYYFNLLASIAGIVGVFTAVDMFLFFFFWEVMLLPMTALIAIWGHENRLFAAVKFFIFTQMSSLLMLVAIIATAYFHYQQVARPEFLLSRLANTQYSDRSCQLFNVGLFYRFCSEATLSTCS